MGSGYNLDAFKRGVNLKPHFIGQDAGSTDMGDIAHLMPAIHPYAVGSRGQGHGNDWQIADPYIAYVLPAKLMALTAVDLLACVLSPGGRRALAQVAAISTGGAPSIIAVVEDSPNQTGQR